MKEKIAKLIDLKSIVTLSLVFTTIGLAFTDKIEAAKVVGLAEMVMIFYFGMKSVDHKEKKE